MIPSGIYKIEHRETGKVYVGSAVCVSGRWRKHRSELGRGVHHSQHLQRAWAKYGAEAFDFVCLERVERERLIEREQFWIDHLRAFTEGFNALPTAGNCLGRVHSEETRRKMSAWQIGRKMSPESIARSVAGRRGYQASAEARAKISAAGRGRPKSAEMRAKLSATLKANWKPSEKMIEASRRVRLGVKFSAEVIAKRVATRAKNRALKMAAQAVAA